jgi:two-component system cell cycle response regulator
MLPESPQVSPDTGKYHSAWRDSGHFHRQSSIMAVRPAANENQDEPGLLDRLIALTSIRDLEILELSLLKTLHDIYQPQVIELLKLGADRRPQRETVYRDGLCSVRHEKIDVPADLDIAIANLHSHPPREHITSGNGSQRIIYPISGVGSGTMLLIITTASGLSLPDSQLVAGMLQIYRNYFLLLRDAQTDQLTGLANRKTFDESIKKISDLVSMQDGRTTANERRARDEAVFWLAMVDIDHFKAINDRFGHLYGDEVLVLMAQMLKAAFRRDDLIFRFGGEEFVLMIRCTDRDACHRTLQRFRETVQQRQFPQIGQVTISIGATQFNGSTFPATLLDYADQALYFSKSNGRNQVTFFEDMLERGLTSLKNVPSGSVELF